MSRPIPMARVYFKSERMSGYGLGVSQSVKSVAIGGKHEIELWPWPIDMYRFVYIEGVKRTAFFVEKGEISTAEPLDQAIEFPRPEPKGKPDGGGGGGGGALTLAVAPLSEAAAVSAYGLDRTIQATGRKPPKT